MSRRGLALRVLLAGLLLLMLAGCARTGSSTLSPHGPKAGIVARSWWILFAVAAFVCVIVIAMAVLAAVFRRRATKVHHGDARKFVLVAGVIVPALVFAATFALSVGDIASNADPPRRARTTIKVVGHQWWWEVRYPGSGAVTANDIHVPVGTPVQLELSTADVIHSFWVPELMPKMDLIPQRVNRTWVSADKAGVYIGHCAEYCGLQHAHMGFRVVAQPPAAYRAWLSGQSADASTPAPNSLKSDGEAVFTGTTCATCHTIRGTSANGDVGPDLTHVGSRPRLAGGLVPNDFGHMSGWVANSQTVKPGNKMPPQPLSPHDLRAVVAYLQSLE